METIKLDQLENHENKIKLAKLLKDNISLVTGAGCTINLFQASPHQEKPSNDQKVVMAMNWSGLIRGMAEEIKNNVSGDDLKKINTVINTTGEQYNKETDLYLKNAQILKDLSEEVYYKAIKNLVEDNINKKAVTNIGLLSAINIFDCPVITTNYDTALDKELGYESVTFSYNTEDIEGNTEIIQRLTSAERDKDQIVLHTHGLFNKPESIVFDTQSYDNVTEKLAAHDVNMAINQTWVFVGCGATIFDKHFIEIMTSSGDRGVQIPNIIYICTDHEMNSFEESLKDGNDLHKEIRERVIYLIIGHNDLAEAVFKLAMIRFYAKDANKPEANLPNRENNIKVPLIKEKEYPTLDEPYNHNKHIKNVKSKIRRKDINEPGELIVVTGKSGTGKSGLLKDLRCWENPDESDRNSFFYHAFSTGNSYKDKKNNANFIDFIEKSLSEEHLSKNLLPSIKLKDKNAAKVFYQWKRGLYRRDEDGFNGALNLSSYDSIELFFYLLQLSVSFDFALDSCECMMRCEDQPGAHTIVSNDFRYFIDRLCAVQNNISVNIMILSQLYISDLRQYKRARSIHVKGYIKEGKNTKACNHLTEAIKYIDKKLRDVNEVSSPNYILDTLIPASAVDGLFPTGIYKNFLSYREDSEYSELRPGIEEITINEGTQQEVIYFRIHDKLKYKLRSLGKEIYPDKIQEGHKKYAKYLLSHLSLESHLDSISAKNILIALNHLLDSESSEEGFVQNIFDLFNELNRSTNSEDLEERTTRYATFFDHSNDKAKAVLSTQRADYIFGNIHGLHNYITPFLENLKSRPDKLDDSKDVVGNLNGAIGHSYMVGLKLDSAISTGEDNLLSISQELFNKNDLSFLYRRDFSADKSISITPDNNKVWTLVDRACALTDRLMYDGRDVKIEHAKNLLNNCIDYVNAAVEDRQNHLDSIEQVKTSKHFMLQVLHGRLSYIIGLRKRFKNVRGNAFGHIKICLDSDDKLLAQSDSVSSDETKTSFLKGYHGLPHIIWFEYFCFWYSRYLLNKNLDASEIPIDVQRVIDKCKNRTQYFNPDEIQKREGYFSQNQLNLCHLKATQKILQTNIIDPTSGSDIIKGIVDGYNESKYYMAQAAKTDLTLDLNIQMLEYTSCLINHSPWKFKETKQDLIETVNNYYVFVFDNIFNISRNLAHSSGSRYFSDRLSRVEKKFANNGIILGSSQS